MDAEPVADHVEPADVNDESSRPLHDVLGRSQELGFLGPGRVEDHVRHAQAFLQIVEEHVLDDPSGAEHLRVLDLGSGGGIPGLAIAVAFPRIRTVLLDAMQRRCRFLEEAVSTLQLDVSAEVVCGRAEVLARDPRLRGTFHVVIARSFGPPAVTAECAVGFLIPSRGVLLVSEPPSPDMTRWPASGLSRLGLEVVERRSTEVATVQIVRSVAAVDARYPRRTGVPAKRPLF